MKWILVCVSWATKINCVSLEPNHNPSATATNKVRSNRTLFLRICYAAFLGGCFISLCPRPPATSCRAAFFLLTTDNGSLGPLSEKQERRFHSVNSETDRTSRLGREGMRGVVHVAATKVISQNDSKKVLQMT